VNSPALDLATLPASPQQRRAALVAIGSLGAIALVAALFARVVVGTFPGFVTLYGGAVLMGLAITATILFGQYALSRRPSLLALACGTLFSAIVFVPYILTFPGSGIAPMFGALTNTSTYLWVVWHTALPGAFAAYAFMSRRDGPRRVGSRPTTVAVAATVVAAYAAIQLVFALGAFLPPLAQNGQYLVGSYVALGVVVVLAGTALVTLQRRAGRTVVDVWLTVPAAALLIESLLNALGGSRYSVGWYLSRLDILVATTFLVVALLAETNRLSHVLATSERRLRGIVNGVTDALIAVDARGAVASVNPAAAALFGFVADDLTGTPVSRVLPEYAGIPDAPQASVVETTGRDARGTLFPVEFARGRDATAIGETIIILRDITQRKAAEEAIRAAHDRAVEAAEVKSQFVATMSHEIRTPINAVVGMSELLLQTSLSDEAREYATTVRDSAESLLAIVNDILDFSKIEAGRMRLESAPFSPVVAVENATDILAAAARKKGLSLTTYVAPDVPLRVAGDADRLRQVLLNLLGNAVKFTASGSVTVRAVVDRVDGENALELRFSVTDTGPGIAQDAAEQLFEPFRQADQSTRRRFGGTGLGLSISRRLVELMGGKIGFDSSPGRGSTFWFTVPFTRVLDAERERSDALRGARILVVDSEADARQVVDQYLLAWGAAASSTGNAAHALELARAAAERSAPFDAVVADRRASGDAYGFAARLHALDGCANLPIVLLTGGEEAVTAQDARAHGFVSVVRKPIRQNVLHDALVAALADPSAPAVPAPPGPLLTRSADRVLVLVAEDNPVNRRLALQQLKKLGFRADAVTDGREAIDAVAHGTYDLVLMDCQMPEVDGFEATREIRRNEALRGGHVPIIAMTANGLEGDRQACLAAGMDDYLAKPVQLAALRAVVERFANGVGVAG
jgi:PAS domain S-box-containing protein